MLLVTSEHARSLSARKTRTEKAEIRASNVKQRETTAVISQPTYLSWLGYFRIMKEADIFVFLDNVQFEPRSWQCRNRIKSPGGWQWLSVPIKRESQSTICNTKIDNSKQWKRQHWKAIKSCYGKAEFFHLYAPFFKSVYEAEWGNIALLNIHITKYLATQLGISPLFVQASKLGLEGKRTKLLLDICKMFDADRYVSSIGAHEYMKEDGAAEIFEKEKIKVQFLQYIHPIYPQLFGEFIPELSVIDCLFNCGPNSANVMFTENTAANREL